MVYTNDKDLLLSKISCLIDKINILNSMILKFYSRYKKLLKNIRCLDGAKAICGHEIDICKTFLNEALYQNESQNQNISPGM